MSHGSRLPRVFRWGRGAEAGAQSLEWIGLGSFVMSAMLAATAYARDHLGDQLGQTLVNHIKTFVQ